jgi:hypothetical protein
MKRQIRVGLLAVVLLACLVSCAGLQAKWNALTPNEQARIILNGLQDQLTIAFDQAKLQIGTKPEWKTKVVPAFDIANKSLAKMYELGNSPILTPQMVLSKVQAQVDEALQTALKYGWIKK